MELESYVKTEAYNYPFYSIVSANIKFYPNYDKSWKLPRFIKDNEVIFDLRAAIDNDIILRPLDSCMIPLGMSVELPPGYYLEIISKGGLATTYKVVVLNSPSIIFSSYKGELKVCLINLGKEDFTIRRGDRVASARVCPSVAIAFADSEYVE